MKNRIAVFIILIGLLELPVFGQIESVAFSPNELMISNEKVSIITIEHELIDTEIQVLLFPSLKEIEKVARKYECNDRIESIVLEFSIDEKEIICISGVQVKSKTDCQNLEMKLIGLIKTCVLSDSYNIFQIPFVFFIEIF